MISNADKQITVFSNEGKLYQVEYSFQAVKNSGYSSVGVRFDKGVVVLTQKKIPDKSIVQSSVTHIFKVTEEIGVLFTGSLPDSKNVLMKMKEHSLQFLDDFGYTIPINVLAQKVSEDCQFYTQQAHMRPLCCISMLFSLDLEKGPQLIKIDPAGHYLGYKACATGEKEESLTSYLEREIRGRKKELNQDEAISLAIKALQFVSI